MRRVWIIPKDEIEAHFRANERQDIKIIVPERLTSALQEILTKQGKSLKPELPCEDVVWRHSARNEPNRNWQSDEFELESEPAAAQEPAAVPAKSASAAGLLALAFGNEKTPQEAHCHRRHFELYFSEHHLQAEWRGPDDSDFKRVDLPAGGAVIFAPGTVHKMRFGGLAIIIEFPAVKDDKFTA